MKKKYIFNKFNTIQNENYISNGNRVNKNIKVNFNSIKSFYFLPPIDKRIKNLSKKKPTTIIDDFITKHAKDLINYTERSLFSPINIKNKQENKIRFNSKSLKKLIIKSEEKKNMDNIKINLRQNKILNKVSLGILLTNIGKNQKQKKLYNNNNEYIDNDTSNISEDNDININELYEKYNEDTKKRKKTLINSIPRNNKIKKYSPQKISTCYRRICTYKPEIKLNCKNKYGLKYSLRENNEYKTKNKEVDYQSKIIDNYYKLLFNNINDYKNKIENVYYFVYFENLDLTQKINYNKSLEETIGIIALLSKLILNNFYELIKNSYGEKIPIEKNLEEKYVFDEVETLKGNNKLFFEIIDYFEESYKIFQTVVKEFDKILFKSKEFNKIISCFEKACFNISHINNSLKKIFDSFNNDLNMINLNDRNNGILKDLVPKIIQTYSLEKNGPQKIINNNILTDRNISNTKVKKYEINTPYRTKIKNIVSP